MKLRDEFFVEKKIWEKKMLRRGKLDMVPAKVLQEIHTKTVDSMRKKCLKE